MFLESVKFENAPAEQHPIEGFKAKINCTVSGSPKPEVLWFKKQKKPDDVGDFEVNIERKWLHD